MSERTKQYLTMAFRAVITLGLMFYLFRMVDWQDVWSNVSQTRLMPFLVAILLLLMTVVVAGVRWKLIIDCLEKKTQSLVSFSHAIGLTFEATLFSQVLPSTIGGDAVRAARVLSRGLELKTSVLSSIADRLSGLATILICTTLAVPFLWSRVEDWRVQALLAGVICVSTAGLVVLYGLAVVPKSWHRWRIISIFSQVAEACRLSLLRSNPGLAAMALSIASLVCASVSLYFIAIALGQDASLWPFLICTPPMLLLAAIPISIAGWGVREGVLLLFLPLFGYASATVVSISLLFGTCLIIIGLPGIIYWALNKQQTNHKDKEL